MLDITKDEFWENKENKYDDINKKKKNKFNSFLEKHKWIALLIASFSLLAISNGLLVYNFLRIINKI